MSAKRPLALYSDKPGVLLTTDTIDLSCLDSYVARDLREYSLGINPSLDLDFSRQQYRRYNGAKGLETIDDPFSDPVSSLITFSRSSTASYCGPDGLPKTAGVDEPRIDYDPSTGECQGLLVEGQSTNYIVGSKYVAPYVSRVVGVSGIPGAFILNEPITTSAGGVGVVLGIGSDHIAVHSCGGTFTGTIAGTTSGATATITSSVITGYNGCSGVTFTPNAGSAFDAAMLGASLMETTGATSRAFWSMPVILSPTVKQSVTWIVKANGRDYCRVSVLDADSTSNSFYANFRITKGVATVVSYGNVGSGGFISAVVKPFGRPSDGLYACSVTGMPNTTGTRVFSVLYILDDSQSIVHTGDATKGIFVFGLQHELGEATSYIPTTLAATTRAADIATVSGTNFSSWHRQDEGTIVVRCELNSKTGIIPAITLNDGTTNEVISLRGNIADPELYVLDGGAVQSQIDTGTIVLTSTGVGPVNTLAATYKVNDFSAGYAGGEVFVDTAGTIPSPTQMKIGSDGTNYLGGHISSILFYPKKLTDSQVSEAIK